jgi:Zn-dependent protease
MNLNIVQKIYEAIAFLFAISVHESAHAWVANRCGDPTARMLGRITLNPIKHIDPIGTILIPVVALYYNYPLIGWAKPTPVDPRHFKYQVRDDILTSLAGPASNLLVAFVAVIGLAIVSSTSILGHELVHGAVVGSSSLLEPFTQMLYAFLEINVLLAAFNIIPVPPLDGSHVLRHFLPDNIRQIYDRIGVFALILLFVAGSRIIAFFTAPFFAFFDAILARI